MIKEINTQTALSATIQQNQAGESLKQEVNHLRLLEYVMTYTNDAILITEAEPLDSPGPRILYVNDAFTRMTGYSPEEVIGQSPRILQGPKTDKKELKRLSEALREWESCEVTVLNYKKNGDEFWINFTVTPIADENGWFTHWVSINRDITERIKLEMEYNQIFIHAPDIICTIGLDGYFKKVNPATFALLEYSEEELLAVPVINFIHPDDQLKLMTELIIKNKDEEIFYFENRCITRSGQIKWLTWTSTPPSPEGLIFTVAKDITEKKELEVLLDKVTTLAGIGAWLIDLKKNTVYWSEMTRQIYEVEAGYEPDIKTAVYFFKELSDQTFISERMVLAIENNTSFDIEIQIITARQNSKWVRVIGEPEFENNKCVRIRGSFQDIDVRKKAELRAIEALEEKKIILESIGDAFFAVDKNWDVSYWNSMAEKVFHRNRNKVIGHNLWDVFPDSIGSESHLQYHQAIENNRSVRFEDYYPPLKWYDISAYPSVNGLSVYLKDITERKRNISAIEEQNARLLDIAWMQSHVVRAPLARIMGIIPMIIDSETYKDERQELLDYLLISANELDGIIRDISEKTEPFKN